MPHQDEGEVELDRAMERTREHLRSLFIRLDGSETSEELVAIEEAVGRFEVAVEAKGGDLMMDEGPKRDDIQPDDPHFVLPKRQLGESVASYLDQIAAATDRVRHHRAH